MTRTKNSSFFRKRGSNIIFCIVVVIFIFWGVSSASYYAGERMAHLYPDISINFMMQLLFGLVVITVGLFQYLKIGQIKVESVNVADQPILEKVSEEDKKEIISALEKKFSDSSTDGIIWSMYTNVQAKLEKFSEVNLAGAIFTQTRERLSNEILSLQRRGNLNLVLGILITIGGLVILGIGLVSPEFLTGEPGHFLQVFLPRLSLVILIEVFAYFFLRLYKSSLDDIKFFQNELTNIESKLTAMQLSYVKKEEKERFCVVSELMRSDRNALQSQNLAKSELPDASTLLEIIKTLADIAKKTN